MSILRERIIPLAILVALSLCIPLNNAAADSCCPHERAAKAAAAKAAEHDGCGHGGHAHGEEDLLSLSLEEIAMARCEHETEAYLCNECRYEVGVVKVPASLLKKDTGEGGLVRTAKAVQKKISSRLSATGEIRLNDKATVHVTPRIPSVIESVSVDIGTDVKKGDVLFTVNSTELGKTLAEHRRNRTLEDLARKIYERETSLFEKEVGSEQDVIDAQAAYEQQKAELTATEQTLRVLGLTEEEIAKSESSPDADMRMLPVRASISGSVLKRHAVAGELVEPGADVMLLSNLEELWVWIDLYEQDLPLFVPGKASKPMPVDITVKAYPGRTFTGAMDYVSALMDEHTRTVKARAVVKNTDGLLRPGMFCRVDVASGTAADALVVPSSAVLTDEGTAFVFRHWKDDYFVRRTVKIGVSHNGDTEIAEGVKDGDTIVTEGAFLLKSDVLREKMGAGCAD
jgi:cobalt-zinc-cadmium efflux system membrane fusion protein